MKIVGIIGGSGFIGSYVTKKFLTETYFTPELTEENYSVRVSATDISKTEKYLHLLSFPNSKNLEIIPVDARDETDLQDFVNGCDILVHCGTPFQLDIADPQGEMFEPTIKGTENLLKIASKTSGLTKLIFVASAAAYNTNFPLPADGRSANHVYTESDPPVVATESHPYNLSKYYADQAVRRYVSEHTKAEMEIVTLSPVFVIGKALSKRVDSTSTGLQFLIKNKIAPNLFIKMLFEQNIEFAVVDVNDVAESIYKTAILPGLHGKHYLLSSESWRVSDLSLMLNNQQPLGNPRKTVSSKLATKELNINFKPAKIPLSDYAAIAENQFQE